MEVVRAAEPERKVFFGVYKIDGDWAYLYRGDCFYKKKMSPYEKERWEVGSEPNLAPSELTLVY